MREYWDAIFLELCNIAEMPDLLSKLKTKELETNYLDEQKKVLSSIKSYQKEYVCLPFGGLIAKIEIDQNEFFMLHLGMLSREYFHEIGNFIVEYSLSIQDLEPAHFMHFCLNFRGKIRLKSSFKSPSSAFNFIGICEDEKYEGHPFDDLYQVYGDIILFRIAPESILYKRCKWFISNCFALRFNRIFVPDFPVILSQLIFEFINENENAPLQNLFYSCTSLHIRQTFIEIYSCLEALYQLPRAIQMKSKFKISISSPEITKLLGELKIAKPRDKDSIEEIFKLIPKNKIDFGELINTSAYKDIDLTKSDEIETKVARRIYKIRNIFVHGSDWEDKEGIKIEDVCIEKSCIFLIKFIIQIYNYYGKELK